MSMEQRILRQRARVERAKGRWIDEMARLVELEALRDQIQEVERLQKTLIRIEKGLPLGPDREPPADVIRIVKRTD